MQQKMHDTEFCVPIQGVYETMIPDSSAERYRLVVDGEYYSGHRYTHIVKNPVPPSAGRVLSLDDFRAKDVARNLAKRIIRRLRNILR